MDDAARVSGSQGAGQLRHDVDHEFGSQPPAALHEIGKRDAFGPFQGEVVEPSFFAVVEGLDDALVLHPRSVLGLAKEPLSRVFVISEARLENLDRALAVVGVFGAVDHGGSAFADAFEEMVTGDGASGEVFLCHRSRRK